MHAYVYVRSGVSPITDVDIDEEVDVLNEGDDVVGVYSHRAEEWFHVQCRCSRIAVMMIRGDAVVDNPVKTVVN